jgi:hypothetical protein
MDPPVTPPLPISSVYVLQGLQAQPSFNGHKVRLVEWLPKESRYVIHPMEPNSSPLPPILSIKPANLKPLDQEDKTSTKTSDGSSGGRQKYAPGDRLVLQGLKAQLQFNGFCVVVTGFLYDQGRYKVIPAYKNSPLPPTLAIRPENLVAENAQGKLESRTLRRSSLGAAPSDLRRGLGKKEKSQPSMTRSASSQSLGPHAALDAPTQTTRSASSNALDDAHEHNATNLHLPGTELCLQWLRSAPHFNGHHVVIKVYLPDENRYKITRASNSGPLPPEFSVKPDNLILPGREGLTRPSSDRSLGSIRSLGSQRQLDAPSQVAKPDSLVSLVKSGSRRIAGEGVQTGSQRKLVKTGSQREMVKTGSKRSLMQIVPKSASKGSVVLLEPNGAFPSGPRRRNSMASSSPHASGLLQPGAQMALVGLQSKPSWNGEEVVVLRFLFEEGRYEVRPVNPMSKIPPEVAIKPSNLRPVTRSTLVGDDRSAGLSTDNSLVPLNNAVPLGEDKTSPDHTSFKSCSPSTQACYVLGIEVVAYNADNPDLDGHKFIIVQVYETARKYRLEPIGPEALDACLGGNVIVAHDHLIPNEPTTDQVAEISPGGRGVIHGYSPRLNGHLVKVVNYNPRRKSYLVQPLGKLATTSAGSNAIVLPDRNITEAPASAFWSPMAKNGEQLWVPCVAEARQNPLSLQIEVKVYLSVFPGLAKVAEIAKFVLGEGKCEDWTNMGKVLATLRRNGSKPINVAVEDESVLRLLQENETVVRGDKLSTTVESLVEFELLEKIDRTLDGSLSVYKMKFPPLVEASDTLKPAVNPRSSPNSVLQQEWEDMRSSKYQMDTNVPQSARLSARAQSERSTRRFCGSDDEFDEVVYKSKRRSSMKNSSSSGQLKKEASSRRLVKQGSSRNLHKQPSSRHLGSKKSSMRNSFRTNNDGKPTSGAEHPEADGRSSSLDVLEDLVTKECDKTQLDEDIAVLRSHLKGAKAIRIS